MGCAVIEPFPIEDEFVSGFLSIEAAGGECVRLTFVSEQTLHEAGDKRVAVVARKLVIPLSALAVMLQAGAAFVARQSPLMLSLVE